MFNMMTDLYLQVEQGSVKDLKSFVLKHSKEIFSTDSKGERISKQFEKYINKVTQLMSVSRCWIDGSATVEQLTKTYDNSIIFGAQFLRHTNPIEKEDFKNQLGPYIINDQNKEEKETVRERNSASSRDIKEILYEAQLNSILNEREKFEKEEDILPSADTVQFFLDEQKFQELLKDVLISFARLAMFMKQNYNTMIS